VESDVTRESEDDMPRAAAMPFRVVSAPVLAAVAEERDEGRGLQLREHAEGPAHSDLLLPDSADAYD
jgi:hypothetical protein